MSDRIATAVRPRPRGFAPWNPSGASLDLVLAVQAVLDAFADYLPLTNRQVFYRLVATTGYEKSERGYKSLCEKINRAKRARLLEWSDFRDDGITRTYPPGYESREAIEAAIDRVAKAGINRQVWQEVQQIVLAEAAGMVPQLARVADDYGVEVMSSSGFDSSTGRYQLAEQVAWYGRQGKRVVVHHIGDFDPSGVHVYQSLADDVTAFVAALGGDVTFRRVAITPEQIARHNLPEAPAKATDNRSFTGTGTVQAEALPPDQLADLVRDALGECFDKDTARAGDAESSRIIAEVLASRGRP